MTVPPGLSGMMRAVTPSEVLDFWFKQDRKAWFEKNPAFDEEVRARFLPLCEKALKQDLDF